MNTAAVSVNRGCNYVRLSLPDTGCCLATCPRDRAKAGSHFNPPPPPDIKKKKKKKQRISGDRCDELHFPEPEGVMGTPHKDPRTGALQTFTDSVLEI